MGRGKIEINKQMDREQQIKPVRDYVTENFVSADMCADIAIYDKEYGKPYAHIMLTISAVHILSEITDFNENEVEVSVFYLSERQQSMACYNCLIKELHVILRTWETIEPGGYPLFRRGYPSRYHIPWVWEKGGRC